MRVLDSLSLYTEMARWRPKDASHEKYRHPVDSVTQRLPAYRNFSSQHFPLSALTRSGSLHVSSIVLIYMRWVVREVVRLEILPYDNFRSLAISTLKAS
jgi:hypothetical protein